MAGAIEQQGLDRKGEETIRFSTPEVWSFALVTGVLATFRRAYLYGLVNQIEHLPPIRHLIDPTLYAADWHVAQNLAFGPRTYYYHLIALLGSVVPLPVVMLVGTVLANAATMGMTFLVGRTLFRNDMAAALGCVMVAAVHSFDLGGATFLTWEYLVQASLAEPLAMAALWACLRLRPDLAVGAGAASAIMHPVVGLEATMIGLSGILLEQGVRWLRSNAPEERRRLLMSIGRITVGVAALFLFAWMVFLRRMPADISDEAFFRILVHFRNPHHYVPSAMGQAAWIWFGVFAAGTGLAWWQWWRAEPEQRVPAARVAAMVAVVGGLLIAGYLFVEVWPVRAVASAQLYRNLFIVKWFGLMLVGWSIARWWGEGWKGRWTAVLALAGTGQMQPLAVLAAQVASLGRRRTWVQGLLLGLGTLAVVYAVSTGYLVREGFFMALLLGVAAWFRLRREGLSRWLAPLLLVVTVFGAAILLRREVPLFAELGVFTVQEANDSIDGAARYARTYLDRDAVVLTPPRGGRFRISAERAIVVDFKAFVFQDSSVAGWMARMTDVYGTTDARGFAAAARLDERYRRVPDEHLRYVSREYGAGYAVLYRETPSRFPVLYQDATYKLVRLSGEASHLPGQTGQSRP